MKLRYNNKEMIIANDSPLAKKITHGYDFVIDDRNELVVKETMIEMQNKYQLANAIRQASSISEIKTVLIKLVELIDTVT